MNNKELALFSLGAEKYKKLEAEIIAAYIEQQAKEVPVLPEPDVYEYDIETAMNVLKAHSPDQLQAYGAACAAHTREVALGEAVKIVEAYKIPVGNSASGELACEWTYAALHEIRDEIEALKKAGE